MDIINVSVKLSGGTPNSAPIFPSAGVTMVEENGEMNVKQETKIVATHFLCRAQFRGCSGSSGPFHDIFEFSVLGVRV